MSVYQGDQLQYVREAISSLYAQSLPASKIFIAVDGPVDPSLTRYLESLASVEPCCVYFFDHCEGLAARLNFLIDEALSLGNFDFFARMDSDDLSLPIRFQEQIAYFHSNPSVDIVGSDLVEFHSDGVEVYKAMPSTHNELLSRILFATPLNHPTVMFRARCFRDASFRYDASLESTQDYFLWVDALTRGFRLGNVNLPLVRFRIDRLFWKRRSFNKLRLEISSRLYAVSRLGLTKFHLCWIVPCIVVYRIAPPISKRIISYLIRRRQCSDI